MIGLWLLLSTVVLAESPAPLVRTDFENTTQGWLGMGGGAKVQVAREPAHVHDGRGGLAFEYTVDPKKLPAAILPVTEGSLAGMTAIRFWLKTDVQTTIAVNLNEAKPGGDYSTWLSSPKDTWQLIEVTPVDFSLNDGPTDPKDSNDRLDLDRVRFIGLTDVRPLYNSLADQKASPAFVERIIGTHTLWIDDFQVIGDASKASGGTVVIDSFDRGYVRWLTLGGAALALTDENPTGKRALEMQYTQMDRFFPISHRLGDVDLSHCSRFLFDIASDQNADLNFVVQTRKPGGGDGPRFSAFISVKGGRTLQRKTVLFSQLMQDAGSAPAVFDPAKLKTITILDLSAVLGGPEQKNTIWLAKVSAQ